MRVMIRNIGCIVSGDWRSPFVEGNTIVSDGDKIAYLGTGAPGDGAEPDLVIDAAGMLAAPGLIDSHVHLTFGDYTPRQKTVGYLESYVHGGVTTALSACEAHVPGRPRDVAGVKALAVAAHKSFENIRPGGMRCHGGSIILEPGLTLNDFREVRAEGVWLAKAGFGAVKTPFDYVPLIADAKAAGLITTTHTGGASIPGSSAITGEHVIAMQPHVAFHINGGPTAIKDSDFAPIIEKSQAALQICTAGNLRTTILCARLAEEMGAFDRLIIGTDTPTGSGVMPLGLLYTMAHCASLAGMPPERALCAATGNNARVYGLNCGFLAPGHDADIVLLDAPLGATSNDPLAALKNGDVPAVGAVVTAGIPRFVGRSRNTPAPTRTILIAENRLTRDFSE